MGIFSLGKNKTDNHKDLNSEIERLIDTYGNDVLRIAYMYLKDKHKAEDAFQEVFLKVYKNYEHFKGNSSEKTWLISITINVCKDYLKSAWFRKVTFMDSYIEQETTSDIEDVVLQSMEQDELLKKVMKLPSKYKEVILLYYYEEYDVAQISKALEIPEGTVRSRLHRAREILKNNIEEETLV